VVKKQQKARKRLRAPYMYFFKPLLPLPPCKTTW